MTNPVVDEVGRAVRNSLHGLRPDYETWWRWQRWASLIVAGIVGAAVMGSVSVAIWQASATMERREATKEVALWQSWCSVPGHCVVVAGNRCVRCRLTQRPAGRDREIRTNRIGCWPVTSDCPRLW